MRNFMNFLSGAVVGALVGATLALLLAPHSGDKLRGDLQARVGQLRADVQQAANDRRADLEEQLARLRAPQKGSD
jgi:gas vesicle protein